MDSKLIRITSFNKILKINNRVFSNITISDEEKFSEFYVDFTSYISNLNLDEDLSKRFRKRFKNAIKEGIFDEIFVNMYRNIESGSYDNIDIKMIFNKIFVQANPVSKFFGSKFKDEDYIKLNLTLKHILHPLTTFCYKKNQEVNPDSFNNCLDNYNEVYSKINSFSNINKRKRNIGYKYIKNKYLNNVDILLEHSLPQLESMPELYKKSILSIRRAYELENLYKCFSDNEEPKERVVIIENEFEEMRNPYISSRSSSNDLRTPRLSDDSCLDFSINDLRSRIFSIENKKKYDEKKGKLQTPRQKIKRSL